MNSTSPKSSFNNRDHLAKAKAVLEIERDALTHVAHKLDADFDTACELCLTCQGRVVVTGMGKSGHIGKKLAATLASTGTPAFFVHPGEAAHGDMGMITKQDVVLGLSYSGETDELNQIIPLLKRMAVPLIAITGNAKSTLGQAAAAILNSGVEKEACPLNLAPTASTTAALALGDALAVALLSARNFNAEDFARSHPSGRLGKRLLLNVSDVMQTGDAVPRVQPTTSLAETLMEMSRKKLGFTAIVDNTNKAQGIFTDGDLRRVLTQNTDIHNTSIAELMTRDFIHARPDTLAHDALQLLEKNKITDLLVLDDQRQCVGALNIHHLFLAGIV